MPGLQAQTQRNPATSHPSASGGSKKPNGAKAPGSPLRSFGPVSDLERHLPSDWWRSLFNAFYLKTDGDVVENPENTHAEVDAVLQQLKLNKTDRILDLCCGQGRHTLELVRRGYQHVVGCDRSRYLIRQARRRARREALDVTFHEGDARRFRPRGGQFNAVIMMGNSFGYFEQPADDEAVLRNVASLLADDGRLYLDLADGDWLSTHLEARAWEWIDEQHFVCRERALAQDGRRIITREVITHAEKGVLADQFYAERLYTRSQIAALLEGCGFSGVTFMEAPETASTRGHDLGMMAHRLIITADAPRKTAAARKPLKKITVLMGDPELPDTVKVGGKFNEEDFATIQKLKDALATMDDFEFDYVSDHPTLIETMRSAPPQFVLNLCDEGYNNDAFLELHVPALLEMLGVPYTGAGPACLGLCYNKGLVAAIAQTLDIPVPLETYIGPDDSLATLPSTFPALLKPNCGDSSIGITKNAVVHNAEQVIGYIDWMRTTYGRNAILVQEFLTGPEYTVGIVGNPGLSYRVFPPLEVDYSGLPDDLPPILGYESKWHPDSPYWTDIRYKEAEITQEVRRNLIDYSNRLFERLGCRDYARFDFRVGADGEAKLMEVNPNPAWANDGKLAFMASFAGHSYPQMLNLILEAAQARLLAARE